MNAIVIVFSLIVAGTSLWQTGTVVSDERPSQNEVEYTTSKGVERYVWPDNADPITYSNGSASPFAPVSLTIGNVEGAMLFAAELRNISDEGVSSHDLLFTVNDGEITFGTETLGGSPGWVPSGGSLFFFDADLYDGTVLVEDWSMFSWHVEPGFFEGDSSIEAISLNFDDGRIYNSSDKLVGEIYFQSVLRDSDGVYMGHCAGSGTAQVPANHYVRIPPSITDESDGGLGCLNAVSAEEVSTSLRSGSITGGEWIMILIP